MSKPKALPTEPLPPLDSNDLAEWDRRRELRPADYAELPVAERRRIDALLGLQDENGISYL